MSNDLQEKTPIDLNQYVWTVPPEERKEGTVYITIDMRPFYQVMHELDDLGVRERFSYPGVLFERVGDIAEWWKTRHEFVPAGRTTDTLVIFEPSERLLEFLAALRTGNRD